jgi:hypothetical protein
MSIRASSYGRVVLASVLCLVVAGCGASRPRVLKVSGTVNRGGKPVDRLIVNFEPQHGRPSWGVTDKDGHYSLNYEPGRPGAVAGIHKIWVQVQPASPQEEADLRGGVLKLHPEIQSILSKYGQFQTTPLEREVHENNQVIDLKLD